MRDKGRRNHSLILRSDKFVYVGEEMIGWFVALFFVVERFGALSIG